jgi:hypothetical protein
MWHHEVVLIHDEAAVQDQVEIESARRTRVRSFAAELSFDIHEGLEKVAGRQGRIARRDGIQKSRLIADANGIGFAKRGYAEFLQVLPEGGDRFAQQTLAVPEIATQSYRDRHHR